MQFNIKKDKYMSARGGTAQFLIIKCTTCNHDVLLYQKDGPGNLVRMYKDRIVAPVELAAQQEKINRKEDMKGLVCPQCNTLLAVPMVYKSENRLAYRIIHGKIHKMRSAGIWSPGSPNNVIDFDKTLAKIKCHTAT